MNIPTPLAAALWSAAAFACPLTATASAQGAADAPKIQAFTGQSERMATRVFLYTRAPGFRPMGQMSIDYGPVEWKDEYATRVASSELDNRRWRLGKDFWTNLNNNVPVSIGGARIAPGHRYLTVVRRPGNQYFLEFNDPAKIRPRRLDAFQSDTPTMPDADFAVRLDHADKAAGDAGDAELAKTLTIRLVSTPQDVTKGRLEILFGSHVLSCRFELHP